MCAVKRHYFSPSLFKALVAVFGVFFFCEYIIYYIVLSQCKWPVLDPQKNDSNVPAPMPEETPIKVMFITDTHLFGPKRGYWMDKIKREWQMYRTFQTAISLHEPNVVFVMGDLFDEGESVNEEQFEAYVARFHSIFSVPQNIQMYIISGNHDIGFHYSINSKKVQRFVDYMNAPNVQNISINGNHFVLINSVALEGDRCFLCKPTEDAIQKIGEHLKCAKNDDQNCDKNNTIERYSRPILVQHFPLYRESDAICNENDEAPADIKNDKFKERWDCLSREASDQLLDILNPRFVVDGHTHYGCRNIHRQDILEVTVPSFNWRNIDNPSFLLSVFSPNNYAISKCHMPVESKLFVVYIISGICIAYYLIISFRRSRSCRKFNLIYFISVL